MEEKKLRQLKKLQTLQEEPNLAFFDELEDVCDKLEGIQGVLSTINSKESKTYEMELKTLQEAILSLTESVNNKETVVNIPLDQLSTQLVKVEQAIKAIGVFKEVKIPEFPSELNLSEVQINELLLAIESIPEFPIKELEKMISSLAEKLKQEKIQIPEFDYERLERGLRDVVRAVKNVSITVSSGGGGIDDISRQNLTNISNNTLSYVSSNIDMGDATNYYFLYFIPTTTKWRINRLNKTTYVSDYALGDSSIATAWTNRATQTYTTIY